MTERRRLRMGFRARVLGFSAALLVSAAVVGLFLQRAVLHQRLDREVSAALDQERLELETLAAGRNPTTGALFDGDVAAIFDTFLRRNVPGEGEVYVAYVGGSLFRTSPPIDGVRLDQVPELTERWANLTAGERGELSTNAGPVEYLAVPLRSGEQTTGVFVIANFLRGEQAEIDAGIRVEAAVAAAVLLVALGGAWVTAGRLLRPVRELTETAHSITETDLSQRIPVEGQDEIAELAATFNDMLTGSPPRSAPNERSSMTPATSCARPSRSCAVTSSSWATPPRIDGRRSHWSPTSSIGWLGSSTTCCCWPRPSSPTSCGPSPSS